MAQPRSRLHGLPAEIRVMIYSLVVISPIPIPARIHIRDVAKALDDSKPEESTVFKTQYKITPEQPALSRVDTSIRDEVLQVFYGANTFLFRTTDLELYPLRNWLQITQRGYSAMNQSIRHVVLERAVKKTCTLGRLSDQEHIYRIAVKLADDGKLSVHFEGDLAALCACDLQACVPLQPDRPLLMPVRFGANSSSSRAIELAADIEGDFDGLSSLGSECSWGLCLEDNFTRCSDCGRVVHKDARRRMGNGLRSIYERMQK